MGESRGMLERGLITRTDIMSQLKVRVHENDS